MENRKIKLLIILALFVLVISFTVQVHDYIGTAVLSAIVLLGVLVTVFSKAKISDYTEEMLSYPEKATHGDGILNSPAEIYYGDELSFSTADLDRILTKRFPYYKELLQPEKERFLKRLEEFIEIKTFKIHVKPGYIEMPVLISAAAIQLTFGLKKYLLPHFEFIHVYPEEFMRVHPVICLLEGNVSGHSINLSWKHFLDGYEDCSDGKNVGLHEMAHALYYQTFVIEEHVDDGFRRTFDEFEMDGNKVYETEKSTAGGLYSEYGEKNFQEFWAESAELFFEKPGALKNLYPTLYASIRILLNQDPSPT